MNRTRLAAVAIAATGLLGCSRQQALRVGAKNTTEQAVLAEIVAQHLERRLRLPVERSLNLGDTLVTHQALLTGTVDLYPEYCGVVLSVILKLPPEPNPTTAFERVRNELRARSAIEWLDPLGFSNDYALVVRAGEARAAGLETVSDAAGYAARWTLGVSRQFLEQPTWYQRLMTVYGLPLAAGPKVMDPGRLYQALAKKEVGMVAGHATDSALTSADFKVLRDDKDAFASAQAALAVRSDALARYPALKPALAELAGKFSAELMRQLNYQVDVERRPLAEVAASFLRQAGLQ